MHTGTRAEFLYPQEELFLSFKPQKICIFKKKVYVLSTSLTFGDAENGLKLSVRESVVKCIVQREHLPKLFDHTMRLNGRGNEDEDTP